MNTRTQMLARAVRPLAAGAPLVVRGQLDSHRSRGLSVRRRPAGGTFGSTRAAMVSSAAAHFRYGQPSRCGRGRFSAGVFGCPKCSCLAIAAATNRALERIANGGGNFSLRLLWCRRCQPFSYDVERARNALMHALAGFAETVALRDQPHATACVGRPSAGGRRTGVIRPQFDSTFARAVRPLAASGRPVRLKQGRRGECGHQRAPAWQATVTLPWRHSSARALGYTKARCLATVGASNGALERIANGGRQFLVSRAVGAAVVNRSAATLNRNA